MLEDESVFRIKGPAKGIPGQQQFSNEIRIGAPLPNFVAEYLKPVLEATRLVDVDVGSQRLGVSVLHESHLDVGVFIPALVAGLEHLVAFERIVEGAGDVVEARRIVQEVIHVGVDPAEAAVLPDDEWGLNVPETVVRRLMPTLREDIQQARLTEIAQPAIQLPTAQIEEVSVFRFRGPHGRGVEKVPLGLHQPGERGGLDALHPRGSGRQAERVGTAVHEPVWLDALEEAEP
jgi:hypothetical protein